MLIKSGTKYTGYYSTDGINFNSLGSTTASIYNPRLGPFACNGRGSSAQSFDATFSYLNIFDEKDAFGSLSEIRINGEPLREFSPDVVAYSIVLPRGTTAVPLVEATPASQEMTVTVTDATSIPGVTRVTVSSKGSSKTYSIAFGYAPVSEDFTDGHMDESVWTILNPDPENYSLDEGLGLRLPTLDGDIYANGTSWKNVFVQSAAGDWEIEAKTYYPTAPSATYQQQAVLVWQDADNYIKLDTEYSWMGSLMVQFGYESNGSFSGAYSASLSNIQPGSPDFEIYYRIKKTGNTYEGYYSLDGIEYTKLGTIQLELANTQLGLFATKNSTNATIDTYCQYIKVLSYEEPDQALITLNGPVLANIGDTIEVTYGLANVEKISAQDITIKYDKDLFEYVGLVIKDEETTKLLQPEYNDADAGTVRFIIAHPGRGNAISGSADVLTIQFKVKASGTGLIEASAELGSSSGDVIVPDGNKVTVVVGADKSLLEETISRAQALYDQAVEGIEIGQYPAGTKDRILKQAITAAQAILANPAATPDDIAQAIADLNAAIEKFKSLVITEKTGDINDIPGHDIGDIGLVAYYYGTKAGDPDWDVIKKADINGDGEIGLYELGFIARKLIEQ